MPPFTREDYFAADTYPEIRESEINGVGQGNIAGKFLQMYEASHEMLYLNRAITQAQSALNVLPESSVHRVHILKELSYMLGERHEQLGEMKDLEMAVEKAKESVAQAPTDNPRRVVCLGNLGVILAKQYQRTGKFEDLQEAITGTGDLLAALSDDHPERPAALGNLAAMLEFRYKHTRSMEDLNQAISFTKEAYSTMPDENPDRIGQLSNLGYMLNGRYGRKMGNFQDVTSRIPEGSNSPETRELTELRTSALKDLHDAIDFTEQTAEGLPAKHPTRANALANLGKLLFVKYGQGHQIRDLQLAIAKTEEALEIFSSDHPHRAGCLTNRGNMLGSLFERIDEMDGLKRSIADAEVALSLNGMTGRDRILCLSNLGNLQGWMYERTQNMEDLDQAVARLKEVMETISMDHPDRLLYWNQLGKLLFSRYLQIRSMDDLQEIIAIADANKGDDDNETSETEDPDRVACMHELGISEASREKLIGVIDELENMITVTEKKMKGLTVGDLERTAALRKLGMLQRLRYQGIDGMEELHRSIASCHQAVEATPAGSLDKARRLENLGDKHQLKFFRDHDMDNCDEAVSSFTQCFKCDNAQPSVRISGASKAAILLNAQYKWEESNSILEEAVKLLPQICPRSLKRNDQQHVLREFSGLVTKAASVALNAHKDPSHAVEMLELGRGIMSGLLLDTRTDITCLKEKHYELAERFELLRSELNSHLPSMPNDEAVTSMAEQNRRHILTEQFGTLLKEIRSKESFEDFLEPLRAKKMTEAAASGPVVLINVSHHRCDAFLIRSTGVQSLELPELHISDVREKAKRMKSIRRSSIGSIESLNEMFRILQWLWDAVVGPVLDTLGFRETPQNEHWPRVFWVPTDQLASFPIHAAGYHLAKDRKTALDRVVSSYSPSVKAFLQTKEQGVKRSDENAQVNVVLASMSTTPDLPNHNLPHAKAEVQGLTHLLSPSKSLTVILLPQPLKADVLKALSTCTIFHFAGHGTSSIRNPSQSSLLFSDWKTNPLTVEDLMDLNLSEKQPLLGYLSACSTGENQSAQLQDESIHLMNACLLAGFRHVVGSLWEVSDRECVDVAKEVYKSILRRGLSDDDAIARGLHAAVRRSRDKFKGEGENERGTGGGVSDVTEKLANFAISGEGKGRDISNSNDAEEKHLPELTHGDFGLRNAEAVSSQTVDGMKIGNPFIWASYIHIGV
jgi:CHAT domain-containing protein/tetratricopeptide (TPR) repeat protein